MGWVNYSARSFRFLAKYQGKVKYEKKFGWIGMNIWMRLNILKDFSQIPERISILSYQILKSDSIYQNMWNISLSTAGICISMLTLIKGKFFVQFQII